MRKYVYLIPILGTFFVCLSYFAKIDTKEDLLYENVEALTQIDISTTKTAMYKHKDTESKFAGYEREVVGDTIYLYELFYVYEIVSCEGEGKIPCESSVNDLGMERVPLS